MSALPGRVHAARSDDGQAVLEGVHALKHAVRFGAELETILTPDRARFGELLAELAPDVAADLPVVVREVDDGVWEACCPHGLPSPSLALARRPDTDPADVLAAPGRVVILEEPTHLGNVGAVVRVAAAAGVGGVLVVGGADPWHAVAIRGGAGLQFALPVTRTADLAPLARPAVAVDPGGSGLHDTPLPADAALLFGTERHGLSPDLRDRADRRVAIPMRPGVSSLNLATAVAVVCYAAEYDGGAVGSEVAT